MELVSLAASEPQGSTCLYLPSTGITRENHPTQLFYMASGDQVQVPMLVRQELYQLNVLSLALLPGLKNDPLASTSQMVDLQVSPSSENSAF